MTARSSNRLKVGQIVDVPGHIARCPECDSKLHCQLTTPDLRDLDVECEFEASCEEADQTHRHWQGEWQPIIERVEAWLKTQFSFNGLPPTINSQPSTNS